MDGRGASDQYSSEECGEERKGATRDEQKEGGNKRVPECVGH